PPNHKPFQFRLRSRRCREALAGSARLFDARVIRPPRPVPCNAAQLLQLRWFAARRTPAEHLVAGMGIVSQLRDNVVFLRGALRALRETTPIAKNPTRVFPVVIDELASQYGEAPALLSDRESFSYRTLTERANRYARWALQQDLAKGETVCLLMPNRPEYMAIWIGINSMGGVVALINTNLIGPSLAYCIDIVAPKH